MKTNRNYSFDLDDTFVGTRFYSLNRTIVHNFRDKDLKREINRLIETHAPSQTAPKWVQDKIWEQLDNGRFMVEAQPTKSLMRNMEAFKKWLQVKLDQGKTLSITTHRGWHPSGETYSRYWLDKYDLLKYFSDIHVLGYHEQPNKLDYLKERYGKDFLIFDDNPILDKPDLKTEPGDNELVQICRSEHAFPHLNKLGGFADFKEIIRHF